MLTVKDFNRITFLHHRGIVPPSPAKEGETAVEPAAPAIPEGMTAFLEKRPRIFTGE